MYFKQHLRIAALLGVTLLGAAIGQTARAGQEPATSEVGEYTQQMANTEIGYFELMSNHPFTDEERRDILANSNAAFHRKPQVFMQNIKSNAKFLHDYAALSPVYKQEWRYKLLTGLFMPQIANWISTPTEIADYQRIIKHYVQPLFAQTADPLGRIETVMLLPEDVQAGWTAIQFFADKLGVSAPSREQYLGLIKEVCTKRCEAGSPGRSFLAYMGDMDSRWLALETYIKISKDGGASHRELTNVPADKRQDPVQLALAVPPAFNDTLDLYAVQFDSDGKAFPADVQIARFKQLRANRGAFLNAALNVSRPIR